MRLCRKNRYDGLGGEEGDNTNYFCAGAVTAPLTCRTAGPVEGYSGRGGQGVKPDERYRIVLLRCFGQRRTEYDGGGRLLEVVWSSVIISLGVLLLLAVGAGMLVFTLLKRYRRK